MPANSRDVTSTMAKKKENPFYDLCRSKNQAFSPTEIHQLFQSVNDQRIQSISSDISGYIESNLPKHFNKRKKLPDYRSNPYVLMTSASALNLDNPNVFAKFLFDSKFYTALETSFGKSVESIFIKHYPINNSMKWEESPEKISELAGLAGLTRQEKAKARLKSIWREIDRSVVVGDHRYLTTIKSGPNTINDTQVQAMTDSISTHFRDWMAETQKNYPGVDKLDIVIGLTYGTDRTTNNKENQILVKLLEQGFVEEDNVRHPCVLIDSDTESIRIYRSIGRDFWSFIGDPANPNNAQFVFLEILLGLARSLANTVEGRSMEQGINQRMLDLSLALQRLTLPEDTLPDWVRSSFSEKQMFWFTTAMSAFFDEGI
jgi:hypothetical protein